MHDLRISVEVLTLSRGGRVAFVQAIDHAPPRLAGARFLDAGKYPTEGEFRAAIADAVAQLLDEQP